MNDGDPPQADGVEASSSVACVAGVDLEQVQRRVEAGRAPPLTLVSLHARQNVVRLRREDQFGHGLFARGGGAVPAPKPARIGAVGRDHLLEVLVREQACFGGRHDLCWLPDKGAVWLSMHEVPVVLSEPSEVGAAPILQRDKNRFTHAGMIPAHPVARIGLCPTVHRPAAYAGRHVALHQCQR